jgi:NAD(P)-dependent dehydrogenase (short-subunit alcohol dehydrogenase family)
MTAWNWLITGVSSGFGRELATQLLDRGDTVFRRASNQSPGGLPDSGEVPLRSAGPEPGEDAAPRDGVRGAASVTWRGLCQGVT